MRAPVREVHGVPTDRSLEAKTTPEALAKLRHLAEAARPHIDDEIELTGPEATVRFLVWLTPELVLHLLDKAEAESRKVEL